ncbi:MAG: ABC transporter substrate-binding protein [Lachnospiraceae bacterium]|nr:ABC transporter substrate-binding protein [Lachnospiraceae bacterium]
MNKKKLLALALSTVMAVTMLAGCGGSGSSEDSTGAAAEGSGSGQDTLTVAMSSDATSLDPVAVNNVYSSNIMQQMYSTLVNLDEDGNVVPNLAESYEVSDDGLTYTFKLKQGVKFHNGDEMKASDVVFSLKRAQAAAAVSHIFGDIDPDSFETPDDYTVTFKTNVANTGFIFGLAHTGGGIVSEKVVTEAGDNYTNEPIGTGPFKFVSWSKNDTIELERFDDYFGEAPVLKTMTFKIITEATNRAIELESGGVDMAFDISTNDISRVEENSELQLVRMVDNQTTFFAFNCEKEPFNDQRVRQAIAYAIDTTGVVDAVWRGVGQAAVGPIAPNVKYFDDSLTAHEYNVEKAKELLAEAGYENGFTFTISTNERQERIDMATIIQSQLKEVGITAEIEVLEWGALLEKAGNREQDVMMAGWTCQTPDPDMAVYAPFHSQKNGQVGNNYANFGSETVDALLEQGRTTVDSDEREQIYHDIQAAINEECPWVYLNNGEVVVGAKANLTGFTPTPYGYHSLYNISFK